MVHYHNSILVKIFINIAGIFLPWHHLAYFCCTPAVLLVISMMFLPKTPTYLTRRGNAELAARSLAWLRGTSVEAVRHGLL